MHWRKKDKNKSKRIEEENRGAKKKGEKRGDERITEEKEVEERKGEDRQGEQKNTEVNAKSKRLVKEKDHSITFHITVVLLHYNYTIKYAIAQHNTWYTNN